VVRKLTYHLIQGFPTCGMRTTGGTRTVARWYAETFQNQKIYHKCTHRETCFDCVVRKTKIMFNRWYTKEILLIRWYLVSKRLGTPDLINYNFVPQAF
jgi:hypothetical protein